MVTPAEKRDPNKYCEFHSDTRHSMDECMQLRKQIDEMIKSGKLSQFIKELKQNDKPKAPKKGEVAARLNDWRPNENIAEHRLNIREGYSPVRQKKRGQARKGIRKFKNKWKIGVNAKIIKVRSIIASWLSNPVLVKKQEGTVANVRRLQRSQQRMCPKGLLPPTENRLKWLPLGYLSNVSWMHTRIGRNLEVYVDDLVIKSHTEEGKIRDITETFKTLRQINMKLNPKKCTSRNAGGNVSSYKRQKRAIFMDTPEAEKPQADEELIAELPTLTHKEQDELIITLAAAKEAISAVLMTDREGRQIPVYFVSRTLRGPEINYTPMEKLVLALLSASKRLKRYFQAYTIVTITDQPIKQQCQIRKYLKEWPEMEFQLEGYDNAI
ncbi:reverse transcriptase domain-containing protein [Tanacetum coccineum]